MYVEHVNQFLSEGSSSGKFIAWAEKKRHVSFLFLFIAPADFNVPVMVEGKCGRGHEEKAEAYVW